MSAQIIDGKSLAASIRQQVGERVAQRVASGLRKPGLAVILVGQNPASQVYVRKKIESCRETGVVSRAFELADNISQDQLLMLIAELNADAEIDGILVQLPLPAHIDANTIIEAIDPAKDVDGFHPYNVGRLAQRNPALRPCTPYGEIRLLDSIGETYKGRHAVIVGASNIVGRPMSLELLLAGATVTVCHRFTGDLAHYVLPATTWLERAEVPYALQSLAGCCPTPYMIYADAVLEPDPAYDVFAAACRDAGLPVMVGRWRVPGRPRTILVEFSGLLQSKDELLAELWEKHSVDSLLGGWDYVEPLLFGYAAGRVIDLWWRHFLAGRQQHSARRKSSCQPSLHWPAVSGRREWLRLRLR